MNLDYLWLRIYSTYANLRDVNVESIVVTDETVYEFNPDLR